MRFAHALRHHALDVVEQGAGFGQRVDGLGHFGIRLDGQAARIVDAERARVHLALEFALEPVLVPGELGLGEGDFLVQQELWNSSRYSVSGSQPLTSLALCMPRYLETKLKMAHLRSTAI